MNERDHDFVHTDEVDTQYQGAAEGLQDFTDEEAQRLIAARDNYDRSPEARAMLTQERRLEFALWLAEQGRIGEGLPGNGVNAVQGYAPEIRFPLQRPSNKR